MAEVLAQQPETSRGPRRRLIEYSPAVEVLTDIADRLAELTGIVAASAGAKVGPPPRAPRPVTALEEVRRERRMQRHRSLVARVLPQEQPPQ